MKIIKYQYVDYFKDGTPSGIGDILDKYNIPNEMSSEPDYIIHFPYGREYLNYNCVRIFWTGEDISPDFNTSDYAVGFDYLNYGDRYCRYPLYLSYTQDWKKALKKHLEEFPLAEEKKFCNFIYSNARADKERTDFFHLLSQYRQVDSGGKYMNNIGAPVKDKYLFQRNYKFSIAFENASTPGYTTEKIVQAFAAGTIPIYWGNPLIHLEFNTKAFINCHDYSSWDEVIDVIRKIDSNDDLYNQYLKEPMLTPEQEKNALIIQENFERFVLNIFTQPIEEAYRRNRGYWGRHYEEEMKRQLLDMDVGRMNGRTLRWVIRSFIYEHWIQARHKLHLLKVACIKRINKC